jgi:membrane protease YdiL (CAAX protease family)
VTQLASVAFTSDKDFLDIFLPSAIALLLISAPLAASGLLLGPKIGLGAPLLTALLTRSPGALRGVVKVIGLAAGIGLSLGLFLWLLRLATVESLPPTLPELGHRGAIGGLLVSVGAAIAEEVWLRLGVMTILAWVLVRALGQRHLTPGIAWVAIVISALVFGAIHLPQLAAAGAASTIGITATMLGNSVVGIACGWLFWKHGIVPPIVAHFAIDLVLHVLPAVLS